MRQYNPDDQIVIKTRRTYRPDDLIALPGWEPRPPAPAPAPAEGQGEEEIPAPGPERQAWLAPILEEQQELQTLMQHRRLSEGEQARLGELQRTLRRYAGRLLVEQEQREREQLGQEGC